MKIVVAAVKLAAGSALLLFCPAVGLRSVQAARDLLPGTGCFWLGAAAYLGLALVCKGPARLYVFGHELTHALWVWIFGEKVLGFSAGAGGGNVRASRMNSMILLSPYIFPLYALVLAGAIVGVRLAGVRFPPALPLLYAALGFAWALHLAFTASLLLRGQPDIRAAGRVFSWPLIFIANCFLLIGFLALVRPGARALPALAGLFRAAWETTAEWGAGVAQRWG
ncbi:MAG TPA: hypothetical protein PK636_03300 [bacterium]|nr:hypothetical protein [bacterium]HPJ71691.1 hypothetical protein [bacterium]HPQ67460.1 hypothetical protein [bacterium]